MNGTTVPTRVLALLFALLVLAGACGGDGDEEPSSVATVDVPSIAETAPTADATVPEAPEPPDEAAPAEPFLAGVSEEVGEALGYCAQGARGGAHEVHERAPAVSVRSREGCACKGEEP